MPYFLHGDRRLYFSDSGGSGVAVVLLHGLGSRGRDWRLQTAALSPEFRVLTPDFPGHGASAPLAGPVTLAQLASVVTDLLDQQGIPRAHLVGLSLGGMAGLQLASDCPQRLLSLTVINAGPGPDGAVWRLRLLVALRATLVRVFGLPALARRLGPRLFPKPQQQSMREEFLASIAEVDEPSYLHLLRAIGRFDLRGRIGRCEVPTLVLCGDQDYTPVAFKQAWVAMMPNASLRVIADSRHATPLDQPELCNQEIRRFLLGPVAAGSSSQQAVEKQPVPLAVVVDDKIKHLSD